jgi:hypothetical protein
MTSTSTSAEITRAAPAPLMQQTTRDAVRITEALEAAASQCHLVSPAMSCGALPEGCAVALSTVRIDVAAETYPISGGDGESASSAKVGLSKTGLDKIAAAAGISWDPERSHRLDDGRDPRYCSFVACGSYRHFDGREIVLQGTKEMDLRDGSAQVEALHERYRAKLKRWEASGKRGYPPKAPDAQIREMRLHILGHAETKARLRAIRALGIRTSYTTQELAKPFVVARLMFSGQTDDPELRRTFAVMQAQAMLASSRALYGDAAIARASAVPQFRPAPAPALGRGQLDDDDEGAPSPAAETALEAQPAPAAAPAEAAPPQPTEAAHDEKPRAATASGFLVPGGHFGGKPIEEADDRSLTYWAGRLEEALANGTARHPDKDRALVEAMRAELQARRSAEA